MIGWPRYACRFINPYNARVGRRGAVNGVVGNELVVPRARVPFARARPWTSSRSQIGVHVTPVRAVRISATSGADWPANGPRDSPIWLRRSRRRRKDCRAPGAEYMLWVT